MTNTTETIIIKATKESAEAIRTEIDAQPGSQSYLTERKNLDGDTAAWILVANVALQSLPHVLGFIKDFSATKQVKKIKVGDWEVENPTPEMVERSLLLLDARMKQENEDVKLPGTSH